MLEYLLLKDWLGKKLDSMNSMNNRTHAKFTGDDGSLGLSKGSEYPVDVVERGNYVWVRWYEDIYSLKPIGQCPYSDRTALHKNWAF